MVDKWCPSFLSIFECVHIFCPFFFASVNGGFLLAFFSFGWMVSEPLVHFPDQNGCWQIRNLVEKDLDDVLELCSKSFPLDYPLEWYKAVIAGEFISFGLFCDDLLTSLLVAQRKKIFECESEDRSLCKDPNATVIYILSLAVSERYRRRGIGTLLLNHLITSYSVPMASKLIFLHVLSANHWAIVFYRRNGFRHHMTLPKYYFIDGKYHDGQTFVLFTSQGLLGEFVSSVRDWCAVAMNLFTSPFWRCFFSKKETPNRQTDENCRFAI